jgi:PKD repeat protein
VSRNFTFDCPCWPGDAVGFDVDHPREQPSYALVQAYEWDFGDGQKTGGWYESATSHAYRQPGTYTVTLTMVDEEGARWFLTKTIEVKAPRPAAESPNPLMYKDIEVVCPDDNCSAGSYLTFNPVLVPEDGVHSYPVIVSWDWGDGSSEPPYSSTYATHAYSQPGSYAVTMNLADENGDRWFVTKQVQITG